MKPWLTGCWQVLRFCTDCVGSLALWTLWLALLIAIGVQLTILAARELAVPGFILREITARMAAADLHAEFGRAQFDPSGRLLVENVRISTPSIGGPLLTARTIYLKLDPWALLLRDVELTQVRATGVDLIVPAMFSPAGRSEAVLRDLHASVFIDQEHRRLIFEEVDARVANIEVTGRGELILPTLRPDRPPLVAELIRRHLQLSRRAMAHFPELESLTSPRLIFELIPDESHLAVVELELLADRLSLESGLPGWTHATILTQPRVRTSFPLSGAAGTRLAVDLRGRHLDAAEVGGLHQPHLHLEGSVEPALTGYALDRIQLGASQITAHGFVIESAHLEARPGPLFPDTSWGIAARIDGTAWTATGEMDLSTRAGSVAIGGALPHTLLTRIAAHTDARLATLLNYETPPAITARVRLADGGRPVSAEGMFVTGPLIARNVPLDATRGRVAWAGGRIEVTDIELRTGASLAQGTYSMDWQTRDFRFLLTGRLQPGAINGWFRDWWPRFWGNFDFPGAPPEADVEVAGRWGWPWLTRVFVQAKAGPSVIRGVSMDKIQTRLFIRPGHFDGLEFLAEQGPHAARGRFTYSHNLTARAFRSLDFAVRTDLPPDEVAAIAGPRLATILEPYDFNSPPEVDARGRLTGATAPGGAGATVDLIVRSQGPMTFMEFPLENLGFRASIEGNRVSVESLTAGFAGGLVSGRGEVDGTGEDRRLGFDGNLIGAHLGESIRTLEEYSALRAGLPPPPQSRFQQRIAEGRLYMDLSADGPLKDPYNFKGMGNLQISGANLGEINMLGILSALLRPTLLNHSTLQLDTARANFTIEGNRVVFPEVKLTGPRAAIDARGHYRLDAKTVDFMTRVHPFEESRSLLSAALDTLLTPLSSVLEVHLTGSLANPNWAFAYGPTSLLRAIMGSDPGERGPAPAPAITPSPAGGEAE